MFRDHAHNADSPEISIARNVEELSPIERVPKELLLQIFELAPECLFTMRQVSRMLRVRSFEYALVACKRVNRGEDDDQMVTQLEFTTIGHHTCDFASKIGMTVPKSNVYLLDQLLISKFEHCKLITRIPISNQITYGILVRSDEQYSLESLREWIGNRLVGVKIIFDERFEQQIMSAVSQLIKGTECDRLVIAIDNMSDDIANYILDLITAHKVNQLSLTVEKTGKVTEKFAFLCDLSSLIRTLYLKQRFVSGVKQNSAYLFGMFSADWAYIVKEMFRRKLDKLCVENSLYSGYLKRVDAEWLEQQLQSLGKTLWFEASCAMRTSDRNTRNLKRDYLIEYSRKCDTDSRGKLSVKHASRINEDFSQF